jgi:hypothetical protein
MTDNNFSSQVSTIISDRSQIITHDHSYATQESLDFNNEDPDESTLINNHMKMFQINLRKSKVATYELTFNLKGENIALVQEPWFYKNKPMGSTQHLKAFYDTNLSLGILIHPSNGM